MLMRLAHRECRPGWATHWFRSLQETEPMSLPDCEPLSLGSRQNGPPLASLVSLKEVGCGETVNTSRVKLYLLILPLSPKN